MRGSAILFRVINIFSPINGYDKDGNFVGMKRYGSSNNLADEFGYSYFSGTNKLQTIGEGLTAYNYTYDKNGNMTSDQLNRTGSIKYDHRNLMTDVRAVKTENGVFGPEDITYWTVYRYDEAGNRVRKTRYKYTGSDPDPVLDLTGDTPPWTLQSDEFYVRDVSGKEIAIYSGSSLTQWNIWGLDNVGKINADTTRNYYLKDHLGSIRVVLNSTNTVVSAQDYDAWGYQLENRSYNSTAMKYDFTSKERDDETSYDYFGARYYDSRIGRWGQVEPLLNDYLSFTPYSYSLNNPIYLFDIDGNGPREGQENQFKALFDPVTQISNAVSEISDRFNSAIENFSSGNIGMGLLETATLPTLSLGLIPSSPLLDFAMPIGVVTKSSNIIKGEKQLVEFAEELQIMNKGKVEITTGSGKLHLSGDPHYVKSQGITIETPHIHRFEFNINPKTKQVFPKKLPDPDPATFKDLKKAAKVLYKKFQETKLKL